MNNIDWDSAPEWTTHFSPDGVKYIWYKKYHNVWYYYSIDNGSWQLSNNLPSFAERYIPRPVEQNVEEIKEEENMIGKISGVDWGKAPEWATHCHPNNKYFYKLNAEGDYLASVDGEGFKHSGTIKGWATLLGKGCISREQDLGTTKAEQPKPETEWKIRHIKSDDYKCGRDVAITILYKEVGNGYYEYKFAICSPKEMFSRKKGVEEALKKESDKLYDEGSVPFTGLVLMHMSISNKFSKGARSLILSKMAEFV